MITAKQSVHFAQLVQQFDNKQMQSYYEHLLLDEPVEDFFLKFAKYNPNHGADGRFASSGGAGAGSSNVTNVQVQTYPPDENGEISSRVTGEFKTKSGDTVKLIHDNTKLSDGTIEMETVASVVVPGGAKQIGYLNASRGPKSFEQYGATIDSVSVDKEYRREGIASAMLGFARTYSQDGVKIDHSFSLTDDAKAWADVFKYNPNHDARGRFTTGGGSGAGAGAPAGAGAGIVPPAPGSGDYLTADEATLTEGTFDEETQGDELAAVYEDRYNFKDGKPIGTTKDEMDALDHYSRNGYKEINGNLRGDVKTEIDYEEARDIVNNDPRLYEQALEEYEAGHVGPLGDSDYEDAIYEFATSGEHSKEILSIYNAGTSPKVLALKAQTANLDSLIATAPVAFGDKPLYRVFDDKVLAGLKPGDVVTDKGFLSTTRVNVIAENNSGTRSWLSGIDKNPDTAGIILPNKSKNGKGIAVDAFRTAVGASNPVSADEREVLLPRGVPLLFLGYTNFGMEDRAPVFQRMDG